MLVRLENEITKNLKKSMNEIKVFDEQISNKCETCALFKAYKLIFCFIEKSKHFNKSFHRVINNLMQFIAIINKNK